jgi:hypothetical protein
MPGSTLRSRLEERVAVPKQAGSRIGQLLREKRIERLHPQA